MHLWRLIKRNQSLWVSWMYSTALKRKKFWTMKVPTYCSWFWRNILKLRDKAAPLPSYRIGNRLSTSFWLEPWWRGSCIASFPTDCVIINSGSSPNATVGQFISTGAWCLPQPRTSNTHASRAYSNWLASFDFPPFDLSKMDVILWNGMSMLTSYDLWDSIRGVAPVVPWVEAVWLKHGVTRYAHHSWLLCLGRLYTLARLHYTFGMDVSTQCYLCIGGEETDIHFFLHCPYSHYVLTQLLEPMDISVVFDHPWHAFITQVSHVQDTLKRKIALLALHIYAYHLWRERNARAHNKNIFSPENILHCIKVDLHSRLPTVPWFSSNLRNRPEIYVWIA